MKKYHVFYNPLSAHGNGLESTKEIENFITDGEISYEDLTKITDVAGFLNGIGEEDELIFTGGDGTINFVFNALYGKELKKNIYYFPAGSGNDFLNDLGRTKKSGPFPINEYLKGLPIVKINGEERYFVNAIGFGMDGYCCEENDRLKAIGKHKTYSQIAFEGVLGKYHRTNARVTVDGVTKEYKKVWMAPTMFGSYFGGGFNMAPNQDRQNLTHEVTSMVIHGISHVFAIFLFGFIKAGYSEKFPKYVAMRKGRHVKVEFDKPIALQIDGEVRLNLREYEVFANDEKA